MHCQTLEEFRAYKGPASFHVDFLWRLDGSRGSSVVIRKERCYDVGGKHPDTDGGFYNAYHLFNYIDPSRAHHRFSGCRVNPLKEPFLCLDDAMALGVRMVDEALNPHGKRQACRWVRCADVRRAG